MLKRVKEELKSAPNYLKDCCIVRDREFVTKRGIGFEIYRIEIPLKDEVRFVDLITNTSQTFLGLGQSCWSKDNNYDVSKNICDTLALCIDARETFL